MTFDEVQRLIEDQCYDKDGKLNRSKLYVCIQKYGPTLPVTDFYALYCQMIYRKDKDQRSYK